MEYEKNYVVVLLKTTRMSQPEANPLEALNTFEIDFIKLAWQIIIKKNLLTYAFELLILYTINDLSFDTRLFTSLIKWRLTLDPQ